MALCLILLFSAVSVAASAADKLSYVVLGDSIAYGSGLFNPTKAVYGKIVADTNGYDYANYAIPGNTTKDLLNRLKNKNVIKSVEGADIISISIGGNNFLMSNLFGLIYDGIVKEDYTRFDEIAEGFYADLGTVIDTIRGMNADAAILFQTIYNPQTEYIGDVYKEGADRINAKIFQYAEENPGQIIIVDIASVLTDSDKDFAEDRTHPSAVGNEKIAVEILRVLAENGLGTETEPVIKTKGIDVVGPAIYTAFLNLFGKMLHVLSLVKLKVAF